MVAGADRPNPSGRPHEGAGGEGWLLLDEHGGPVDPAVWDLYSAAMGMFGPRPTLIEWDTDAPPLAVLLEEAGRASTVCTACRCREPAMTLSDLQARFADALLTGKDDNVVSLLDDTGLPASALLDIYRASIFASLTATLARTLSARPPDTGRGGSVRRPGSPRLPPTSLLAIHNEPTSATTSIDARVRSSREKCRRMYNTT